MEWKTKVTEMCGCKYPIIQGAYGGFGTAAIAVPVSEAGGLGIITAGALRTPERLREEIRRAKSLTDKPFAVNLTVGICPQIDEMREVVIDEGVKVVFTAAYNAERHGKRLKEAGVTWIHKVATLKHAMAAERHGVDGVVIVGIEGAGHKSPIQISTLANMTMASRMLKIPVIAAGGIGDARGFLGALAMGAEGVYMGTAFMATKECPISDRYKQTLVEGDPYDPKFRDRAFAPPDPERLERLRRGTGEETAPPREWSLTYQDPKDAEELRISGGSLAVGVIDRVKSCKELIDDIINEAEQMLTEKGSLAGLLNR